MNTIQDTSGLPRDRYVNTIYVNTITPFADVPAALLTINGIVRDFFVAIGPNLSWQCAGTGHTVKAYDMALAEGTRVPISPVTYSLAPAGNGLPAEVALVITMEATPRAGVAPMSTRGRMFIGPLASTMVASAGSGQGSRPLPAGVGAFLTAMQNMITDINEVENASVVIASTRQDKADLADGARQAYPVVAISIDNEWDTQRSRGSRSNFRARTVIVTDPTTPRSW